MVIKLVPWLDMMNVWGKPVFFEMLFFVIPHD
jgi:hypothetical protein